MRIFNYKLLPPEYFHPPDENIVIMLGYHGVKNLYPDYWIHLPPEKLLTKYTTKACSYCYVNRYNKFADPWCQWKKLKK
jgi:hypothetical protein